MAHELPQKVCEAMDECRTADALNSIWALISITDKYISDQKPWVLAKNESPEGKAKLANVLAHATASLRVVGLLAAAFFPAKMKILLGALGEDTENMSNAVARSQDFRAILVGHRFTEIPKLYMRLELPEDIAAESAKPAPKADLKPAPKNHAKEPTPSAQREATPEGLITIQDFSKVDLRVATVLIAEHVPNSDKLLHLKVSVGELGTREVFAGIRQWVKPEDLAGRKVIIVANLQPRKMKFGTSEGMLLATDTTEGSVSPILLPDDLKEGARLG
jgi:methionyl-tRNA synthetase